MAELQDRLQAALGDAYRIERDDLCANVRAVAKTIQSSCRVGPVESIHVITSYSIHYTKLYECTRCHNTRRRRSRCSGTGRGNGGIWVPVELTGM